MLKVSPFCPFPHHLHRQIFFQRLFLGRKQRSITAETERRGDRKQRSNTHSKDRIKSGHSHLERRIHCYHPNPAELSPHLVLTLFNNRELPEHCQPFWVMDLNSLTCCTVIFSPILGKLGFNPVRSPTSKIRLNVFLKCKMFGQKSLAHSRRTGEEAGLHPCVAGTYASKRGF